jgi:hypothetical protein
MKAEAQVPSLTGDRIYRPVTRLENGQFQHDGGASSPARGD